MAGNLVEILKLVPPREVIYGILILGLMVLNWHKDKLIRNLSDTLRDLSNDVSGLSELLRVLVYGRSGHGGG